MQTSRFDVAVVGNGVLGLSLAVEIRRQDPATTVVIVGEPDRPGAATPAAGAMLGCFGEVTERSLETSAGRAKLALAVSAQARWPQWLDMLLEHAPEIGPIRTAHETFMILNSVSYGVIDDANFRAVEKSLRMYHRTVEQLDPTTVPWIDPDSNSRPLKALRIPDEGAVDSHALLRALESTAERLGVTSVDGSVHHVDVNSRGAVGVTLTDSTPVMAGKVVMAAGSRTQVLLDRIPGLAGRIPRVFSGSGTSMLIGAGDMSAPEAVLRTPNRSFACGIHIVPRNNDTVYLGATNGIMRHPQRSADVKEVMALLNSAVYQFCRGLSAGTLLHTQVGNRPVAIDGYPLIGETSIPGLSVLTGTYRDGLHLSPLLAEHIALILSDRSGLADLGEFRPEREPIQSASREQTITDIVDHTLAAGYEQPWRLSPKFPEYIGGLVRQVYSALVNNLDEHYTPPAEILAALYHSDDTFRAQVRQYYRDTYRAWHATDQQRVEHMGPAKV